MKLNVIVIDDSSVQLVLASKLIQQNEHLNLVGAYADPLLALNAVNTEKVDVILLDVEMPKIDGFSLLKLFQKKIDVIVNSTRASFEMEAYNNGAVDFIPKPLSAPRLDLAVTRVLAIKHLLAFQKPILNTFAS